MTEPATTYAYGAAVSSDPDEGQNTAFRYKGSDQNTAPGAVINPAGAAETSPTGTDPELVWLASPEARQHENHWVALDPRTGAFLGLADSLPELRMWQARDATIIFVDPPPENWLDG